MKKKKSIKEYRLGVLKKYQRDFEKERKKSDKYHLLAKMPILIEQHDYNDWVNQIRGSLMITKI